MLPRVFLVGPPDPSPDVDPALGRHMALALHAGAAASRFARVRLALTGTRVHDTGSAQATAQELLPSRPEVYRAAYLSGIDPRLTGTIADCLPSATTLIAGVSERLTRSPLLALSSTLGREGTTVLVLTETAVRRWEGFRNITDTAIKLLLAGARAVVMMLDNGDIVLTFGDHRFTLRTGLINAGAPSASRRERIGAAMASYVASIGHDEVPYLRKACLVAMAAALAPRDHALARPDRWRVEHFVRTLEGLTAFSPAPMGIAVDTRRAPSSLLDDSFQAPITESQFTRPRAIQIQNRSTTVQRVADIKPAVVAVGDPSLES